MAEIAVPTYVTLTPRRTARVDNNDFYIPEGLDGIKATVLVPGTDIVINNISNQQEYKFSINYNEYVPLDVTDVSIQAFISAVEESQPILKGKTIDEITISWTRNKDASIQTITQIGGSVDAVQQTYNETGLGITDTVNYELTVNDGLQRDGSIVTIPTPLVFGNTVYYGAGPRYNDLAITGIEAFLDTLTLETKSSLGFTIPLTGGDNERMFIAYPKEWGLARIFYEGEEYGFRRLISVAGNFKYVVGGGETESNLLITNSESFPENYYIYQSDFDNLNGGEVTIQL